MTVDITNSFRYNQKPFPNFIKDDFLDPDEFKVINCVVDKINKIINTSDFDFSNNEYLLSDIHYKNPRYTWETNVMGTINILESLKCTQKKCIIIFSVQVLSFPDNFCKPQLLFVLR